MNIDSLENLQTILEQKGYSKYLNHFGDGTLLFEGLTVTNDRGECISNCLDYMGAPELFGEKIINIYHVPLNLNHMEKACKAEGIPTVFAIHNFQHDDLINLLSYNKISDETASLLNIKNVTESYKEQDQNYSGTVWNIDIEQTTNNIKVYGDYDLDLTIDNHILC
ncbi:hypothetical protein NOVO_03540 [Rickettsiales bacterium Ac37b]|nr:hypothetical protein NOVO_03540 [Rickettsiales bacterium Ac37b]